MTFHIAAVNF